MIARSTMWHVQFPAAIACLALPLIASAQARLRLLGERTSASAVSADGTTVVGSVFHGYEAMRWRADIGVVPLGRLPWPFDSSSLAKAVSADGSIVVGGSEFFTDGPVSWAFRWSEETGILPMGPQPDTSVPGGSMAYAVSHDGHVAAGRGAIPPRDGRMAVMWVDDEAIDLPTPSNSNAAYAITGDGRQIFGMARYGAGYAAFRWTEKDGVQPLMEFDGVTHCSVVPYAVSGDGSLVGGDVYFESGRREAALWTTEGGTRRLGDFPGGRFHSTVDAISGDGTIVLGTGSIEGDSAGFIWDSKRGMRDLRDVLISEYGLTELLKFGRIIPRGISADGRVIAGNIVVADPFIDEGFHLYLGRDCIADWNEDRRANSQDFFDYLNDFFTPGPKADPRRDADVDGDGVTNSSDFFAYIAEFFAGCD